MTRSSKRIKRIHQLQRLGEYSAAAHLRQARQKLAGARQLLADLDQHRDGYRNALAESEDAGQNVDLWRRRRQFVQALEQAMSQQLAHIDVDHHQLDQSQQVWRLRRSESQATEAFLERLRKRENRHAERRANRAEDDWVTAKHGRGKGPSE